MRMGEKKKKTRRNMKAEKGKKNNVKVEKKVGKKEHEDGKEQ